MAKKKNEKTSPFVPVGEEPYQVPKNWCWVVLGELVEIKRGASPRPIKKFITDNENGTNWIKIGDAEGTKYISRIKERITDEGLRKSVFVEKGTLLLSNSMSFGHPYILNVDGCIHDGWLALKPSEYFDKEYLYYSLLASDWYFEQVAVGTAVRNLNSDRVAGTPVPLPPLAEQLRIVDRIESLYAKLDEAKEKMREALESFDLRKSAILNKAFNGSLTSEWRQMHPDIFAKSYLQKLKETGDGISRQEFDFWDNVELPNTWCESKIGKLLYFAGRIGWKGLKAEEYTEEGPLFLSVYNLNDGDEVTFHRVYHITKERYEESPEIMVQVGDVLLTKDGAGIGKLGYVSNLPQEATINSSLLLIRPGEAALSKYVYYLLLSPKLQDIVKERITGSATPHLFQRDIKEFVIPVPPMEEQTEIVRILDNFFIKENQAKAQVETILESIDTMKKSILAKAFRGELGTNNPEDESAEKLILNMVK